METTTNLKRRRSSGEGAAKKMCAGPPCTDDPLEGPSNAFQPTPQQPPPQQTLPRIPIPFPPPPFPPPPLPPLPPSQYPTPQHVPPEPLQIPQPPKPFQPPQSPQLEQSQPPKTRPYQIQHMRRPHSLERQSPQSLPRTLSLPSLSSSSSPELFPELIQAEPEPAAAPAQVAPEAKPMPARRQAKLEIQDVTDEQYRKAVAFCTVGLDSVTDFQLRKLLKPLLDLEKIQKKEYVILWTLRVQPWWPLSSARLAIVPRAYGSSWIRFVRPTWV